MVAPPIAPRRRRTLRMGAAAALVAGVTALAASGGDDSDALEAGTAAYVPAGAPMYFDMTTELEGPQWEQLRELAGRFPAYPMFEAELQDALTMGEQDLDFDNDIRPLLGDRAAVAVTSLEGIDGAPAGDEPGATTRGATEERFLAVIDIGEGARADVEALMARIDAQAAGESQGASLYTAPEGREDGVLAVNDDVIVFADTRAEVETALDTAAAGGEAGLAGSESFVETIGNLPDETLGLVYADIGALASAGGQGVGAPMPFGSIGDLEDGVMGASVIAEPEGLRIKGVARGIGVYEELTSFEPSLVERAPADALMFGEIADISGIIRSQLESMRESGEAPMLDEAAAFAQQLPDILGVTLEDLEALGEGRQALTVVPGPEIPGVVLMAEVSDGDRARATLDALRTATPGLLGLLGDAGPVPATSLWAPVPLAGGIEGWQFPLGNGLSVVYAVSGDLAVMGSSPDAISTVLEPTDPLSGAPSFSSATAGMPDSVTSVSWTNVSAIVQALERFGALEDAPPELLPNLRPLSGIAYWDTGGDEPTYEAFIGIDE